MAAHQMMRRHFSNASDCHYTIEPNRFVTSICQPVNARHTSTSARRASHNSRAFAFPCAVVK